MLVCSKLKTCLVKEKVFIKKLLKYRDWISIFLLRIRALYLCLKGDPARETEGLTILINLEQPLLPVLLQSAPFVPILEERDSAGSEKTKSALSTSFVQTRAGVHRASKEEYPSPSFRYRFREKTLDFPVPRRDPIPTQFSMSLSLHR